MDPIMIVIGLAVVLGVLAFMLSGNDKGNTDNAAISEKPMPSAAQKPAKKAAAPKPATGKPAATKKPASKRVQALKSTDAVKSDAAPKAKALPTPTALGKMTKDNIEETARTYGIELDKRMTKANMISTFLAEAKAAAKAK